MSFWSLTPPALSPVKLLLSRILAVGCNEYSALFPCFLFFHQLITPDGVLLIQWPGLWLLTCWRRCLRTSQGRMESRTYTLPLSHCLIAASSHLLPRTSVQNNLRPPRAFLNFKSSWSTYFPLASIISLGLILGRKPASVQKSDSSYFFIEEGTTPLGKEDLNRTEPSSALLYGLEDVRETALSRAEFLP